MSEQGHFPHLFEPIALRHKTLRNRIVFGAHTVNMSLDGTPSDRHFGYYRERARGGAAMIVVEPVPPHPSGILIRANFRGQDETTVPHFRRITDECKSHGTVMIHQIYHVGQHGDQDHSFHAYWSPSGLPSFHDQHGSHAMTEAEIETMIDAFVSQATARAAGRLRRRRSVLRLQLPDRPVLVADHQPARRSLGRQSRESRALRRRDLFAHPQDVR